MDSLSLTHLAVDSRVAERAIAGVVHALGAVDAARAAVAAGVRRARIPGRLARGAHRRRHAALAQAPAEPGRARTVSRIRCARAAIATLAHALHLPEGRSVTPCSTNRFEFGTKPFRL